MLRGHLLPIITPLEGTGDTITLYHPEARIGMLRGHLLPIVTPQQGTGDTITFKAPMRQLHSNPIAVSGNGDTGKQINSFDAVVLMQESPPRKRLLVGCSSPFTRLAETPHGASRVVLVKTRHAPSRHCRDARGYGVAIQSRKVTRVRESMVIVRSVR